MDSVTQEKASQGCLLRFLADGRSYEIDMNDADEYSEDICAEGARIAYNWGRATHPVSDYDLNQARIKITGEVREIDNLRAALATALAEREADRAEIARLRAENAKLQEEIDERDEWLQLVDTLPLDGFDKLGDYWVQRLAVVQMSQALASVFTKYAPEPIMARFREAMRNIMHQSFVEGCIVGVRTERTNPNRATLAGETQ